jgi:hypothetical protein
MEADPPQDPPANDAPRSFSQAELDQIVARNRREWQEKLEAASQERDTLKARVSELEPAAQERDRLKARVGELEPAVGKQAVEMALLVEAVKAGARRPDHVLRLIDQTSVRLEDGQVKGAAEAIAALASDSPAYFGPASSEQPRPPADGGARSRSAPPPQASPNDGINAAIRGAAGYVSR